MKKFLLLFLVSLNSWAGFVAGSKANLCSRVDYTSISDCQIVEGETCYKVPNDLGECGVFKLKDTYGGPRKSVDECSGQANCEAMLIQKQCLSSQHAFIDKDYSFVYCMDITGKELVIDTVVKAQKDAEKAAKAQVEALIANGAKARGDCQRVLDLIGGFNLLPGRSTEQAGEMATTFAEAKQLLQDGRPGAAKAAIIAIPVDGVLVTQTMKDLALEQLKDW
jgi:hypothetical protein